MVGFAGVFGGACFGEAEKSSSSSSSSVSPWSDIWRRSIAYVVVFGCGLVVTKLLFGGGLVFAGAERVFV